MARIRRKKPDPGEVAAREAAHAAREEWEAGAREQARIRHEERRALLYGTADERLSPE